MQFNRFIARQNWVACGCVTKISPSRSLYISGFTTMSADESVTRPLPVTPVSTTTGQIPERYNEASLIPLITNGCSVSVSVGSAPSWNETKCSDKTPVCFNTPLETLKMKHSPLLDFSASAEGMFFFFFFCRSYDYKWLCISPLLRFSLSPLLSWECEGSKYEGCDSPKWFDKNQMRVAAKCNRWSYIFFRMWQL